MGFLEKEKSEFRSYFRKNVLYREKFNFKKEKY